jgi:hypothetical protein
VGNLLEKLFSCLEPPVVALKRKFLDVASSIEAGTFSEASSAKIDEAAHTVLVVIRSTAEQIIDDDEKQDILSLCDDFIATLAQFWVWGKCKEFQHQSLIHQIYVIPQTMTRYATNTLIRRKN